MDGLKEPKYLKGLKTTSSKFDYKVADDGNYKVDYSNGRSATTTVIEKLKTFATDLNTTSEDVKTMLGAYVLDDSVDINSFVNAVNGGMNSMASQMSTTIQEILTEALGRMDSAEKLDQQLIENETKTTADLNGEGGTGGSGTGTTPTTPEPPPAAFPKVPTYTGAGIPQVGPDGLIVRQNSDAGQAVINKLFAEIPSHANGTHSAQLDAMIDNLSPEECAWVLSRIENEGFGQTGAGYSTATPESHAAFIEQQVIGRYGGDIHNLLKHWGTYSYSGY
jgi:hypothetical protein